MDFWKLSKAESPSSEVCILEVGGAGVVGEIENDDDDDGLLLLLWNSSEE